MSYQASDYAIGCLSIILTVISIILQVVSGCLQVGFKDCIKDIFKGIGLMYTDFTTSITIGQRIFITFIIGLIIAGIFMSIAYAGLNCYLVGYLSGGLGVLLVTLPIIPAIIFMFKKKPKTE